ncbi:MAG: cyclase family protein [Candidatus Hodarchaeota archaeon]
MKLILKGIVYPLPHSNHLISSREDSFIKGIEYFYFDYSLVLKCACGRISKQYGTNHFGTNKFLDHGIGVGKEATLHIVRQGVHIVGTDAWSWDAPFSITAQKWKKSIEDKKPRPSIIWEGHFAGIELGYFQMEKLTNLDKVPPIGATIYCFPVKITKASAGWVRAVATIPD